MHDQISEDLKFISDSIEIVNSRFAKIHNPSEFVDSPDGVTLLDSITIRLQSIGESVKNIVKRDKDFLTPYSEIDWQQIIKFRDFISHHYDEIDHEIVYNICKDYLPALKTTIEKIIKENFK
jgi:uncharacterized protein with HEPN domain